MTQAGNFRRSMFVLSIIFILLLFPLPAFAQDIVESYSDIAVNLTLEKTVTGSFGSDNSPYFQSTLPVQLPVNKSNLNKQQDSDSPVPKVSPLNPEYLSNTPETTTAQRVQSLLTTNSVEIQPHPFGYIPTSVDLSQSQGMDITQSILRDSTRLLATLDSFSYPARFDL